MAYFFFQAEDGIRDLTVTGVQTCALPISIRHTAHPTALAAHVPAVVRIEAPHQLARGGIEGHDVETGGGGVQHPPDHHGGYPPLPAPPAAAGIARPPHPQGLPIVAGDLRRRG